MSNTQSTPWDAQEIDKFIDGVIYENKLGYNLVPFIGSGMSAPSGILMGEQFRDYLGYVVVRVLGLDSEELKLWNLKTQGWPSYPDQNKVKRTKEQIAQQYKALCNKCHWDPYPDGAEDKIKGFAPFTVESKTDRGSVRQDDSLLLSRPLVPDILQVEPEVMEAQRGQRETLRVVGKYKEMLEFSHSPAYSPTSAERIQEYAIRSLHDWRATLHFLSRINVTGSGLRIGESDNSVIDSFNAHIISGKSPNFGHTLLAHLGEPLRFRTILTTNFDNLLEEAFREARKPLRVFEISNKGHLPSNQILQAQNSLVKLHGGLLETRADFSLDEVPDEDDCHAFRKIFSGQQGEGGKRPFLPANLMVIGYSASDMRSVRLIKSVLDYDRSFKVFWVCYNENDAAKLCSVIEEASYSGQLFYCITRRPDLLLYELYQKLAYCLPGGGVSYNYTHRVPPDFTLSKYAEVTKNYNELYLSASADILLKPDTKNSKQHRGEFLPVEKDGYFTIDGKSGVAAHAAALFSEMRTKNNLQCVWLELQDFQDAYGAIFEFLRTIALRRGVFQTEHLIYLLPLETINEEIDPSSEERLKEHLNNLIARLGISPNQWWLFLYGRNVPGRCSGWTCNLNGDWPSRDEPIGKYISVLRRCGFNIVYMPLTKQRLTDFQNRQGYVSSLIASLGKISIERSSKIELPKAISNLGGTGFTKAFETIVGYARECLAESFGNDQCPEEFPARDRITFLYALTLFRQSRHISSLCMEAVYRCPQRFNTDGHDNDVIRMEKIRDWVNQLTENGILWRKPGGTLWMYGDTRASLQELLENFEDIQQEKFEQFSRDREPANEAYYCVGLRLKSQRSRMHYWIGEWYQQAFYATGNHSPLIEAIYHYIQSAANAHAAENKSHVVYRLRRFEAALNAIIKLLLLARPWLKFWMQTYKSPNIFESVTKDSSLKGELEDSLQKIFELLQPEEEEKISSSKDRINTLLTRMHWELISLKSALDGETGSDSVWHSIPEPSPSLSSAQNLTRNIPDFEWMSIDSEALVDDKKWYEKLDERVRQLLGTNQRDKTIIGKIVEWIQSDSKRLVLDKYIKDEIASLLYGAQNQSLQASQIYELAELIGEFCYLITRRARLLQECHGTPLFQKRLDVGKKAKTTNLKQEHTAKIIDRHRAAICASAISGLTICSHLHPYFLDRELTLRLKILDLYGLALAQLGRFYEAHRRFDLVLGLLSKMPIADQNSLRLRTELRKAEAHLEEAHRIRCVLKDGTAKNYRSQLERAGIQLPESVSPPKNNQEEVEKRRRTALGAIVRLHSAKLDDAWVCLENSRAMLTGRIHSTLWSGRQDTLQLQCYSELYPLKFHENFQAGGTPTQSWSSLVLRRSIDHKYQIFGILEHGNLISPSNGFRRLRFLEAALNAMQGLEMHLDGNCNANVLKEEFRCYFEQLKPLLKKSISHILQKRFKAVESFFEVLHNE
jgi:hypothetical protein